MNTYTFFTKRFFRRLLFVIMVFSFSIGASITVCAAGYDFTYESVYQGKPYDKHGHQLTIDGFTISGKYTHRIIVSTNNVNSRFRITGYYGTVGSVLTNGKNFIYALCGSSYKDPKEIRCYSWETNSSYEIARIELSSLMAYNGKYLFYTVESDNGSFPLYRLTVSSGKTKKIIPDASIMKYGNGKYIVWREPGDFGTNVQIYVMQKNGTGVKKIAKAMSATIYKKKIFYKRYVSRSGNDVYVKIYRCDLNGKNKKVMGKKVKYNNVSSKYVKMGL